MNNDNLKSFYAPLQKFDSTDKATMLGYEKNGKREAIWIPNSMILQKSGNVNEGHVYRLSNILLKDTNKGKFFDEYAKHLNKVRSINEVAGYDKIESGFRNFVAGVFDICGIQKQIGEFTVNKNAGFGEPLYQYDVETEKGTMTVTRLGTSMYTMEIGTEKVVMSEVCSKEGEFECIEPIMKLKQIFGKEISKEIEQLEELSTKLKAEAQNPHKESRAYRGIQNYSTNVPTEPKVSGLLKKYKG